MNSVSIGEEVLVDTPPADQTSGACAAWKERREQLRAALQQRPVGNIGEDEVAAHFNAMPAHYWDSINQNDLVWGMETVHGFLNLMATPNVSATMPFVNWRQLEQRAQTRIMLCTWDRHGLLAKAAAAFSAVRLNILEADVFTRSDNVVLDVFCVTDSEGRGAASPTRLEEMKFLLEGALSEPPRFASLWACSRHKYLAPATYLSPRITFNNRCAAHTLVQVEASDRLGLLYDILQALADSGLNVVQARVETTDGIAHDLFHVADEHGHKVLDSHSLEDLRRRLETALVCA